MKVCEIAAEINKIAPTTLAQDWDNVGLLIGNPGHTVKNILLSIDVTAPVLAEARRLKTDLIVSYHPIIWDGLKKITLDGATGVVYELIRSGFAVISVHTANISYSRSIGIEKPILIQIRFLGIPTP